MLRILIVELLLFLLPFGLYGVYLLLSRRPWPPPGDPARYWLLVAGLVSAIVGFIALADF